MSGPDIIFSSLQREGEPFTEVPNGQKPPCHPDPMPDTEYYFKNVAFRVGNAIVRVPRNGFEVPGAKFPHSLPEGEDEISILQVDEGHFRSFLRAMYPFNSEHRMTETDWLGALQLATEWSFLKIRDLSISELDRSSWLKAQSPKSIISLAKKYHVVKWLNDAYMKLLQQDSLTLHELRANPALDWETTAKLLSVKLAMLETESRRCYHAEPDSTHMQIYQSNMEKEFREEFENMRSKHQF